MTGPRQFCPTEMCQLKLWGKYPDRSNPLNLGIRQERASGLGQKDTRSTFVCREEGGQGNKGLFIHLEFNIKCKYSVY